MFGIRLTLDKSIDANSIAVTLDGSPISYTVDDSSINLLTDTAGSFHLLKIVNKTDQRFAITKAEVGGCDLRKLLYLS